MSFKFESSEFKNTFQKVLNLTEAEQKYSSELSKDIKSMRVALNGIERVFSIAGNLSYLDEKITYATRQEGFDFVKRISELFDQYKSETNIETYINIISKSAALIYIYLREFEFRVGGFSTSDSFEVGDFKVSVGSALKGDSEYYRYIDFGDRDLEYEILKEFFQSKDMKNLDDLIKKQNEILTALSGISSQISTYDEVLENKKNEVLELEARLDKSKTTYDFVLLNKGFQQLYDEKKKSLESQKKINGFWMFLVISLPIINLYIGKYLSDFEQYNWLNILALVLPVITLIFISLYFYRIGLQERRSIQSQMMQLELRMALCQFIHNYADDSEKLYAKNKAGFEKFENIIFSPLVSSDDKIPTTFDGMEQLAKLVSEFRKQ